MILSLGIYPKEIIRNNKIYIFKSSPQNLS